MVTTILGRKLGMTQVWSEDDKLLPVTVIEAGPCVVTQLKTMKRDGYRAVQIGFGEVRKDRDGNPRINKPLAGHFAKAKVEAKKFLAEMRIGDDDNMHVGQTITVDVFQDVKHVHVTGTSKGKGFAGVMKRHNFKGGPGGHGSHFHRAPGSIGQCATPSRVFKGMKLPGHMGSETVTVKNLDVVRIDAEQNLLLVKGAVPGAKGALLTIRMA